MQQLDGHSHSLQGACRRGGREWQRRGRARGAGSACEASIGHCTAISSASEAWQSTGGREQRPAAPWEHRRTCRGHRHGARCFRLTGGTRSVLAATRWQRRLLGQGCRAPDCGAMRSTPFAGQGSRLQAHSGPLQCTWVLHLGCLRSPSSPSSPKFATPSLSSVCKGRALA